MSKPKVSLSNMKEPTVKPPVVFERNLYGLVENKGVNYVFNEDGTINWRKMINPEYLTPSKQWFEKINKPLPKTIEGLEDKALLILLGGIKELAQLRGYSDVTHTVTCPSDNYVVSVCKIVWYPNYETNNLPSTFSAIGDASLENTNGFGKKFLGPIAENRAFVRAVRSFLKINITGQDEVSPIIPADEVSDNKLAQAMAKFNVPFEAIKQALIKDKYSGAENLTDITQIGRAKQFELAARIAKKAEEVATK
jgi:hypothetical protein